MEIYINSLDEAISLYNDSKEKFEQIMMYLRNKERLRCRY